MKYISDLVHDFEPKVAGILKDKGITGANWDSVYSQLLLKTWHGILTYKPARAGIHTHLNSYLNFVVIRILKYEFYDPNVLAISEEELNKLPWGWDPKLEEEVVSPITYGLDYEFDEKLKQLPAEQEKVLRLLAQGYHKKEISKKMNLNNIKLDMLLKKSQSAFLELIEHE